MDTLTISRRAAAALAAAAFGFAVPLTAGPLAQAASHSRDSDGDRMPNQWERANGLNAHKANAHSDADRDGLANLSEFREGTDPQDADSDDDGVEDGDDDSPECADAADDGTDDGSDDGTDDTPDDRAASQADDDC